jgi:hypothetical protein
MIQLKINNQDLTTSADKTFLAGDAGIGDTTLSVDSIELFAINQVLLVGTIGSEGSEIIKTHASTAPTGTTITLASALTQGHSRGTPIYIIEYDQYELSNASSATGAKTLLTTPLGASGLINIDPQVIETLYSDLQFTSGGYFVRRFNSIASYYSSYSDFIPYTGFADNTIGSVKDRALRHLGETRNNLITDQFLNEALYEARRTVDQDPRVFRWSFRTKFATPIGQCVSGAWTVTVPSDLRDRNTYKNILGLTLGRQNRPCVYQPRVRFNQNYLNVAHTTLNGPVVFGASTITLTSSHDLDDSGVISIAGNAVGTLHTNVQYTSNNRATNTLSGVTGVPVAGYVTGLDVWQNANFFGLPTAYTIDNGLIQFDVPFYDALDGRNVIMDYYAALPTITTDGDTFDEPFYDLYVSWLKWRIKYAKSNGKIDRDSDPDFRDWNDGISRIIAQETTGQRIWMIPDVEGFLSATQ